MNENIDKLKDIFLSGNVDDEDYADNLKDITKLEKSYIENQNALEWQEHDLTKKLVVLARKQYREIALHLATNRKLTEAERQSRYAKQDAMEWIISVASTDAREELVRLDEDVKKAMSRM